MKKQKTINIQNDRIEKTLFRYGDENVLWKIEFVKEFMGKNFNIDDFENSFIEIDRTSSKCFMWLLFSLIVEYDCMKKNPRLIDLSK